jgi:hypothetical protein
MLRRLEGTRYARRQLHILTLRMGCNVDLERQPTSLKDHLQGLKQVHPSYLFVVQKLIVKGFRAY